MRLSACPTTAWAPSSSRTRQLPTPSLPPSRWVPSAGFANYANSAGYAYGLYRVQYVLSAPISNPAGVQSPGFVTCPTGTSVLGGGAFGLGGGAQNINSSFPFRTSGSSYPNGWYVYMNNTSTTTDSTFNVYAICERVDQSTTAFTTRQPAKR